MLTFLDIAFSFLEESLEQLAFYLEFQKTLEFVSYAILIKTCFDRV